MKENFTIVILTIILCLIAFSWGYAAGGKDQRNLAIEAGVAEYQVNPKTGETKFVYVTKDD